MMKGKRNKNCREFVTQIITPACVKIAANAFKFQQLYKIWDKCLRQEGTAPASEPGLYNFSGICPRADCKGKSAPSTKVSDGITAVFTLLRKGEEMVD